MRDCVKMVLQIINKKASALLFVICTIANQIIRFCLFCFVLFCFCFFL